MESRKRKKELESVKNDLAIVVHNTHIHTNTHTHTHTASKNKDKRKDKEMTEGNYHFLVPHERSVEGTALV